MRILSALLLIFLLNAPAPAQAPPQFVLHTIDGPLPAAPLSTLADDWSVTLGAKASRIFSAKEWYSLARPSVALPPYPVKNHVLLTSGDRIALEPGVPFRLAEDRIFFRPHAELTGGKETSAPAAFLSYLCLSVPAGVDDPVGFLSRLEKTKRPKDLLFLKNGDRLEGTLVFPSRGSIYTLNQAERSVATPFEQVAVVAISTELQARPRTKKVFASVVTTSGSRLQITKARLDPAGVTLAATTLFGATFDIPLDQIAALDLRQGRAVFLSDLSPKEYVHKPFLGVPWPLAADANVAGGQLLLGGNYYDKGLGTHSQSRIRYVLDGNFRWFEALVGMDGHSGKRGQAKVSVLLDNRPALGPAELGQTPLPVRLDVRKARELTLLVDFASFGDVQGHVNWANARLLREKE